MTIDGFRPEHRDPFVGFDPRAAARIYAVVRQVARVLRVRVEGIANIPEGRCILVGNHTFGFDVVFAMQAVYHTLQRPVLPLGEHAWWRVPGARRVAAALGTVDGTAENIDLLLAREQLTLVLPGGLRESVKPAELRYRLLWGQRYGFVRAAIRNRAPLVPLACIGGDDLFDFVGNAYRRGERLLRRTGIPIPLPSRLLPIPHLSPLRFVFGEPIMPAVDPEQSEDAQAARRLRREVEGALHELIETELARRSGITL